MAEYFDITSWNEKPWFQTGGTRSKSIVENPLTNKIYYFKTSLKKEQYDYKYEYWSEILASEIGTHLGFDLLKYDIASREHDINPLEIEMGCLSESMVTEGENKLTEGIRYLTGFDTTYNPDDKKSKNLYTFQLIEKALGFFRSKRFIDNIIQIIIFDSIIGNGDRHQENWGIITYYKDVIDKLQEIARKERKSISNKTLFSVLGITAKTKRNDLDKVVENLQLILPGNFSQIYDSGSCLGRELDSVKVKQMLTDETMINAYINKGVSEIHWEGEKLKHFDLITKINKEHSDVVMKTIQQIESKFNHVEISNIVFNIDQNLPSNLESFKLPNERKELILKLVTLRIQKLINLIK